LHKGEIALNSIFGCYIGVRELPNCIRVLAHGLDTLPPKGTYRLDYLEWLDKHSPDALDLLDRMVHGPDPPKQESKSALNPY
jgi:hypothetical protein